TGSCPGGNWLIGGEATLPCVHVAKTGRWPQSARLYWQVGPQNVVYAYYEGQTQSDHQNAKYKGRAMAFESEIRDGNLSLQINNLTIRDGNDYTCYFLVNNRKIYECLVQLQIAAHSSQPVIRTQDIRLGEEVNLSCQSSGGFPKPVFNWTYSGGNSLPIGSQVNTSAQSDPSSGLWNVTSVLRVNVTSNSTFLCSVFNPRTQERQDSELWTYTTHHAEKVSSQPQYLISLSVGVAVLSCVPVVAAIIIVLVKRRNEYTGVARADGTVEETRTHNTATEMHPL
ncbi:CD276 antigen homolog, partial [Mustelus asterias]